MHAVILVFKRLSWRDRATAAQVSREWHEAAQQPDVWDELDLAGQQNAALILQRIPSVPPLVRHLRSVNLEFAAGVEDEHLLSLEGLSLDSINLNACQKLSERAISRLVSKMPDLKSLSLYWNLNVRDGVLFSLAAYNTRLEQLSLSGCKNVTDEGLRTLVRSCTALTHLDLTRCLNITERAYVLAAQCCTRLQELRMYANPRVTDACLRAFGELRGLRLIDLCGANQITDDGMAALANCYQLRSVNLSWCVQITDKGVIALAGGCPRLKSLSLHGILGVSDRSIDELASRCPRLHTLDVNGCTKVERRSRAELKKAFPQLHTTVVHT